jgi:hypothetical protein
MSAQKMYVAIYRGPLEHLRGQKALVRMGPLNIETQSPQYVLAQFDKPVTLSGPDSYVDAGRDLNTGWTRFRTSDFDISLELEFE